MSRWVLATTADVGMVCFAPTFNRLLEEAAMGLQDILLSDDAAKNIQAHVRQTSQWAVEATSNREDLTLVRWLEEVLYQCEIGRRFLVDSQIRVGEQLQAQVSWVDADLVEREIEVKAVTRHDLDCRFVPQGEIVDGDDGIPDFEGPGWTCRVIFDI